MTQDLVARQLDAEFRAAEAKMDALEADARARKAKEEMDEIAGIRARRDRARERLVELKTRAGAELAKTKKDAQRAVHDFEAAIDRANERFLAWDDARNDHLNARLDEAEARLREWKAKVQVARTEEEIRERDALAAVEEKIALAKARGAEWNQSRHERKAAEAARDAARHFDEAYRAASKRYN